MSDEQDWSDPDYVLGAVLAALEDLGRAEALAVLARAGLVVSEWGAP